MGPRNYSCTNNSHITISDNWLHTNAVNHHYKARARRNGYRMFISVYILWRWIFSKFASFGWAIGQVLTKCQASVGGYGRFRLNSNWPPTDLFDNARIIQVFSQKFREIYSRRNIKMDIFQICMSWLTFGLNADILQALCQSLRWILSDPK